MRGRQLAAWRPQLVDWLVFALLGLALIEAVLAPGWGEETPGSTLADAPLAVSIPFAFLWTLPLLLWRWSGLAAGLGVALALAVEGFVSGPATDSSVAFVAFLAASATVGLREDRARAAIGGIGMFLLVLLLISQTDDDGLQAADVFVGAIFAFGPLFAGQIVRDYGKRHDALAERAAELERERLERERQAVADERARIARELHDIVAHGVSVMTLQAGAARTLLHVDPERAREPILAIEQAGREALAETRRLLGILRSDMTPDRAPQPGLAGLGRLVESIQASGRPIDVTVEGEPRALQPGLDLTAFRVVSDSLSEGSSLGAKRARLAIRWSPTQLELAVAGNIEAAPGSVDPWLAAMRERLGLYNGTIDYAILDDGLHGIRARIPLEVSP